VQGIAQGTGEGDEAAFGARFVDASFKEGKHRGCPSISHRMVKGDKNAPNRFRMLPLHLAMEGFLAYQMRGPEIMWSEYTKDAATQGLSPRVETSFSGTWLPGWREALALFEVHPQQVGVMVLVADALASVFVTSHPDDYWSLHRSLIEDFYGALIYEYGLLYPSVAIGETRIDPTKVKSVAELRAAVAQTRRDWTEFGELLSAGLLQREVRFETVRTLGAFTLERFIADLDPNEECHIGERIVREDGTLEYLKTFRLSAAQVRRGHLLKQLAAADWSLEACAELLRCTKDELVRRLSNAGFGYILKPHVLAAAQAGQRS
jgi:hypothetical protein